MHWNPTLDLPRGIVIMRDEERRDFCRPKVADGTNEPSLDRVLRALEEAIQGLDELEADGFRDAGFDRIGPDHAARGSLPWVAYLLPDLQHKPLFVRDELVVVEADRAYEVRARVTGEVLAEHLPDGDTVVRFADWFARQPELMHAHPLGLEQRARVDQAAQRLSGEAILRTKDAQEGSGRQPDTGGSAGYRGPTRPRPALDRRLRPRRGGA